MIIPASRKEIAEKVLRRATNHNMAFVVSSTSRTRGLGRYSQLHLCCVVVVVVVEGFENVDSFFIDGD